MLILLHFTDTTPACADKQNFNANNSGDDEDEEEGGDGVNQAADFDRMMRSELIKVLHNCFLL